MTTTATRWRFRLARRLAIWLVLAWGAPLAVWAAGPDHACVQCHPSPDAVYLESLNGPSAQAAGCPVLDRLSQGLRALQHRLLLLEEDLAQARAAGVYVEPAARRLDGLPLLKLGEEERGQDIGHQVAGADIHPGVFIHLAAEEAAAVGALFAEDFGPLDVALIVDEQGTAFAAGEILGFVEALGGHAAERAEEPALVLAEKAVGVVLDDGGVVPRGDLEDGIHLAADARVVDGHDSLGPGGDERLQLRLIEVERIRPDIRENRLGATKHKGVGRGDEGEGRDDDLVARLEVQQQGGHLNRMRAGCGQQRLAHTEQRFDQGVALPGEGLVTGDLADGHCLEDVLQFAADQRGSIKRY